MKSYTITINDTAHDYDEYPAKQWADIAKASEVRGGLHATLTEQEARPVTPMLATIPGLLVIDGMAYMSKVIAEVKP